MFKEKVCRQGRCGQVQEQDAIQNIFFTPTNASYSQWITDTLLGYFFKLGYR